MRDYEKIIGLRTNKTIYKQGDRVIKMFNKKYKKSQILNEALNLARVEETSLNVPKLLSVHQDEDCWIIELTYIKGKTIHRLMEENHDLFEDYLNLFVELQIEVHQTKAPLLNKMKDKLGYKIEQSDLPATQRMALRQMLDKKPMDLFLCHGDFFPANIIMTDASKPYIIDWAHASIGSRFADVCNTYLDIWIEFSEGVAKHYLSLYNQKTKSNEEDVLSWLSIVSAARSINGLQQERKFLLLLVEKDLEECHDC